MRDIAAHISTFFARIQRCANGESCRRCCWFHQSGITPHPWSGKSTSSSRIAYMLAYGPLLSSDIYVCHTCDNGPQCCNPRHLFLGTAADNAKDRDDKGRGLRGRLRLYTFFVGQNGKRVRVWKFTESALPAAAGSRGGGDSDGTSEVSMASTVPRRGRTEGGAHGPGII